MIREQFLCRATPVDIGRSDIDNHRRVSERQSDLDGIVRGPAAIARFLAERRHQARGSFVA
jgi:hypothetical protein